MIFFLFEKFRSLIVERIDVNEDKGGKAKNFSEFNKSLLNGIPNPNN